MLFRRVFEVGEIIESFEGGRDLEVGPLIKFHFSFGFGNKVIL